MYKSDSMGVWIYITTKITCFKEYLKRMANITKSLIVIVNKETT